MSGRSSSFPVSFATAIASTDVVAQVILQSKLDALEGHALQELQDWSDQDQEIVDTLVSVLKNKENVPTHLKGPGFYAAHVVAAATQAALQRGAQIPVLFDEMQTFLAEMHRDNPTWSQTPTHASLALIEQGLKGVGEEVAKEALTSFMPKLAQPIMH